MADNSTLIAYIQSTINTMMTSAQSAVSDLRLKAQAFTDPSVNETGFLGVPQWHKGQAYDAEAAAEMIKYNNEINGRQPRPMDVKNKDAFFDLEYRVQSLSSVAEFESSFFDSFLDAKIREYAAATSVFIDVNVQKALFDATRRRDKRALRDAVEIAIRKQAAKRGFPVPNDMLVVAQEDLLKKHMENAADQDMKIAALIAERAHDTRKHAIDAGLRMEEIRAKGRLELIGQYAQIMDMLIRKYEADLRHDIAGVQLELEQLRDMNKFRSDNIDRDQAKQIERLKALVSAVGLSLESWKSKIAAEIEAGIAGVRYYEQTTLGFAGQVNAVDFLDKTGTP